MDSYSEVEYYLDNLNKASTMDGLPSISAILEHFGNPQDKLKIIHVAGTNGKGSTCAFLERIIFHGGYKTGMFTSPHFKKYNERIKINNIDISDEEFVKYCNKIYDTCKENEIVPSTFCFLTAVAIIYFYEKGTQISILEVGLGGRKDPTNIVKSPLVSVITSISKDHTEFLGDRICDIAHEKGGIIKKNCPVVLYFQSKTVYNIINSICMQKNAPLIFAEGTIITVHSKNIEKIVFSIDCEYLKIENIEIRLVGDFQINNAITAILAIFSLRRRNIFINDYAIKKGLKHTFWPGRMEISQYNLKTIVFDGAHNLDGAKKLRQSLISNFNGKNINILVGILKNKEYHEIIAEIAPLSKNIIATIPLDKKALPTKELKNVLLKYNKQIYTEENLDDAFDLALEKTDNNEILCCFGSLYLIGQVRHYYSQKYKGEI